VRTGATSTSPSDSAGAGGAIARSYSGHLAIARGDQRDADVCRGGDAAVVVPEAAHREDVRDGYALPLAGR